MENGNKRLAVLVGCNYPNTENELHGCINDVEAMEEVLVKRFGFNQAHIEVLTDAPGSKVMPTGANIKAALNRMVDQAGAGDVLFFHYSGHGTRIPSVNSGHHKQDEAIVPCDFNLITDIDMRQLVNRLPKGTCFTFISDSCHSGGLIDKEKEQIGPSAATKSEKSSSHKPKTISFDSVMQHVSSLTSITNSDIGAHLLEFFGADASLKFHPFQEKLGETSLSRSVKGDEGILLSGCQANETSADVGADEDGGKAFGAFSNSVQMVLKENPGKLSNKEVVMRARELLKKDGFQQHPCLYCSDENADATFLCQP